MGATYATLADLRKSFLEGWKAEWDVSADENLEYASAILRQAFKARGADLDLRLATGELEEIILKRVTCEIVKRVYSTNNLPFGGDFTQLTQSATPYSTSITPTTSAGSFYIKASELKFLGLSSMRVVSFDLIKGGVVKNV